jgi:hypothetical protein
MAQWPARQIHDTVDAILRQPAYGHGARRSLLGRLLRFIGDRLDDLFLAVQGSLNARVVLVITVAAIALVVVARIVVDRRQAEARRSRGASRIRAGERVDLWQLAATAAETGRFDEACHAVHAAVLDQLARDGIVKWHASKTSGDYARELRRRGWPMHAEFRAFARDFERVVFGARGAARDDYLRLRAASERLVARRAAA